MRSFKLNNFNKEDPTRRSKQTLTNEIYSSTIENFLSSSVHGLPHIFRTKHQSFKIIWIFLLLSSCCVCRYYVFHTISDYYNHDTITKIASTTELHPEFPTVSICNYFSALFGLKPIAVDYNFEDLLSKWKSHFENEVVCQQSEVLKQWILENPIFHFAVKVVWNGNVV